MENHLITILSPCYNVEKYLPQCLDSICGQTYQNLQIVLIDDGSKDGTWDVMQEYASRDRRIEIYHQENHGVAATRNHLLEKVKGDYVLFVDSDDWIELDMVEFLVQKAVSGGYGIVTCSMVKNDEPFDKCIQNEDVWEQPKAVREFLRHVTFNGSLWNKLVQTSLLHNVKFHCGISYGEDALFTWYVLQRIDKILITDKVLYHYRMNDASISHGTYDERKMSGHIVWETLAREAKELWPQYADVAEANYAISDMWQIYFAKRSNYPFDEHIKVFQKNVRDHLPLIYRSGLINLMECELPLSRVA